MVAIEIDLVLPGSQEKPTDGGGIDPMERRCGEPRFNGSSALLDDFLIALTAGNHFDEDAGEEETTSGHLTYIVSTQDKPYTAESFGNKFREWCDQAGLKHCSAHGIRKFDATAAAENGATAHQLMAMFGWDSIRQAEHYTRKASQEKLAGRAMHLLAREHEEVG
jgi:hypothetical protein